MKFRYTKEEQAAIETLAQAAVSRAKADEKKSRRPNRAELVKDNVIEYGVLFSDCVTARSCELARMQAGGTRRRK